MTLVAFDPSLCPDCGRALDETVWDQPALVRHGGHGATERRVVRWCVCGWSIGPNVHTVAPGRV